MDEKVQLPRWQSHKKVWADKIVGVVSNGPDGFTNWHLVCGGIIQVFPRSKVLLARGGDDPVGGYYVRYEDGYESWSPAKAFEEGYTRIPDGGP